MYHHYESTSVSLDSLVLSRQVVVVVRVRT